MVSSETYLFPAPPTARADHAMSPPFIRRIWRPSVLIHIHGHLGRGLAFAHPQAHFCSANILVHAVGHLFQLDERGEGVDGLSSSPATPLFLFLGSPMGPSSSIGRSGSPHSAPSKVRNSRSRSCLKRLSFCSMRFSSTYSASSSASSWGVRF